jgi:hypothetical protein
MTCNLKSKIENSKSVDDPAQRAGAGGQSDSGSVGKSRRKVANERVVQGMT